MPANIRRIDPNQPAPVVIRQAAQIMKVGGIIVFPTSGLYGLGADATNEKAVDRIFQIKQRSRTKPILVLIGQVDQVHRLATILPHMAEQLVIRYWPGDVTLVFEAADHLSPTLTAGTGKIGVRLPAHPTAKALVQMVDFPITGTSANLAEQGGCASIAAIPAALINQVDLVLDAGMLAGGKGSTVVDVTGKKPMIIRTGRISSAQILNSIKLPVSPH